MENLKIPLFIGNDGKAIAETNYWDSERAQKGFCYLSWNAGAGRLLLPDSQTVFLKDMQTAKFVIVSRGPWDAQGGRDGLEILFEDNSDSPFSLHLSTESTDRLLPDTEQGSGFVITVWTRDGEQLCLPGKYRRVKKIPCLQPWK